MIQEDKQLLLEDLCGRLPYGVIISWRNEKVEHKRFILESITSKIYKSYKENGKELAIDGKYIEWSLNKEYRLSEFIKPYLRPMSSMTEKERETFNYLCESYYFYSSNISGRNYDYYNWLNSHHFDYRGLIEKGLALEASEGMYEF